MATQNADARWTDIHKKEDSEPKRSSKARMRTVDTAKDNRRNGTTTRPQYIRTEQQPTPHERHDARNQHEKRSYSYSHTSQRTQGPLADIGSFDTCVIVEPRGPA